MASSELIAPLGFGRLVPFDRSIHRGVAAAENSAAFAAKLNAIPVFAAEIIPASRDYPVVFVRESKERPPAVVAVTGIGPRNRFVEADGRWRAGTYVPAYVRMYPFHSVQVKREGNDNGYSESMVCVDDTALQPSDKPYFDSEGNATERFSSHERLLKASDGGRLETSALCARLEELDLLEPFEAEFPSTEGEPRRLRGMLRVTVDRLNALDPAVIHAMMQQGLLARIYAHMMSQDNFQRLA